MRIGFVIDTFDIGGSELNAIKVAEGLARQSIPLTVFHVQQDGALRHRYERIGAALIHVPLSGLVSRSCYRATRRIRREAMVRRLELLHTHCVYSNILGAAASRGGARKVPLLASRRWTGFAVRPGLHKLNAVAQSVADAVLVNTPNLLTRVSGESPFSHPVYIPNMLPASAFRAVSADEKRAARAALGLPARGPIVGCVARLELVKDHATLLTAWQRTVQRRPDATLAIIGGGSLRPALEQLSTELRISERVRFLGEMAPETLPHSLLDICVLSSRDEGFPNSLLEAMAQGLPVVSTNVGGVSDLVQDRVNGLLVASGDAQGLGDALSAVLGDATMAARLASAGAHLAQSHREETVLQALHELYRATARR
ncbi:MAG: glycosyltransferase [Phycisphaerae bacterium]|nr:glycosyltransferase [Gemmatimonadaceae bacterium]